MLKRFIGDRAFYKRAAVIALPIIIQNSVTQFVSLLDNIMVGQTGTLAMSGVSIANQLMFIYSLCLFGASAGAGIFVSQFHGSGNEDGIRHAFRYKLLVCTALSALAIGIFLLFGPQLIDLYLQGEGDPRDAAATLEYGLSYLHIMLFGLLPFAISTAYYGTLRETGNTTLPMVTSIIAVFVNLVLNYVLIYGHFGAPAMGIRGAAVATVISRFVELIIVVSWPHIFSGKFPFIRGLYRSLYIPGKLIWDITRKGMPLMANEFLFALGTALVNQSYSLCGLDVMPAINICNTIYTLMSVVFVAIGVSVGIITGQMMGAGEQKSDIQQCFAKLTFLAVAASSALALVLIAVSGLFPRIYNTSDSVRAIATQLICVSACSMPLSAYVHAAYFAMRAGGKTFVTLLFDSGFVWLGNLTLANCLCRFTSLPIAVIYACVLSLELAKSLVGHLMIRRGSWIQDLTKLS